MDSMTLVVALKSKNGVVLAGDRRRYDPQNTSYNDDAVKVFRLNDKVAIGGGGDGFDCKEVINTMLANPDITKMKLDDIKDLMYHMARNKQAEWYNKNTNNPLLIAFGAVAKPQFGFLLAGFSENNQPMIYSFTNTNLIPRLIPDNYCQIGIVDVAKYIFMEEYKENMTVKELSQLASKAIKATAKISTAVSETLDLIKIEVPKITIPKK